MCTADAIIWIMSPDIASRFAAAYPRRASGTERPRSLPVQRLDLGSGRKNATPDPTLEHSL
jgi:hypothetical protein